MQVDNVFTAIRNRGFCPIVFREADVKPYHIFTEHAIQAHISLWRIGLQKCFLYRKSGHVREFILFHAMNALMIMLSGLNYFTTIQKAAS